MSKLEELINRLCPNGVSYKYFGNVAQYVRGVTYGKDQEVNNGGDGYKLLRANNITLSSNTLNFEDVKIISKGVRVKDSQLLKKGDILICAGSGSKEHIGKVAYVFEDIDYAYGGFMGVIRTNPNIMLSSFMFHILSGSLFKQHLKKVSGASSSTINNINNDTWKDFQIPVPPLPVQEEIVRILDSFTELTAELSAELTAELTARKKQYEYYRDKLLHSDTTIVYKRLGAFCDLLSGFPFDSSRFKETGIKLMRGMNIKRGYFDFSDDNNRYWQTAKSVEKYLLNDQDIVISMDGSLVGSSYGMVFKKDLPLLLVQRVTRIRTKQANARYVYHYIASGRFTEYVQKKKTAGAIPHISLKDISNFVVPLPPIEIQNRLVEVLDNFDSICSDLKIGLPAEIEARKKQYEFYRDKLLSF